MDYNDYHYESDSDVDEDEMPDINNFPHNIQPYMYEPMVGDANNERFDESSSGNSETESEYESESEAEIITGVLCSCNNCGPMPTPRESRCCRDTNIVNGKVESEGLQCITEHEGFRGNCLNIHVLEASYHQSEYEDDLPDEPIHETYRYLAYRRFSWWIYHLRGYKKKRVHPACVVTAIRNRFPSEQDCDFKYPK